MIKLGKDEHYERLYARFKDLQGEYITLQNKYSKMHGKYLNSLKTEVDVLKELKDMREEKLKRLSKANETGETVIHVKRYPESDKRYVNIMSHMDILWHKGETGPDGCGKCNDYRNIIMSALDKIERMSSRNISQDFSTKHINGDSDKEVSDNNNHIYQSRITGQIRGGDKSLDDMEYFSDES